MRKMILLFLLNIVFLSIRNSGIDLLEFDLSFYDKIQEYERLLRREKCLISIMAIETIDYDEKIENSDSAGGILQIKRIKIDEVNRIIDISKWVKRLALKHSVDSIGQITQLSRQRVLTCLKMPNYKYFKYDDRFNFELSVEIYYIDNDYWNYWYEPLQVATNWCGGFMDKSKTNNYRRKFKAVYYD